MRGSMTRAHLKRTSRDPVVTPAHPQQLRAAGARRGGVARMRAWFSVMCVWALALQLSACGAGPRELTEAQIETRRAPGLVAAAGEADGVAQASDPLAILVQASAQPTVSIEVVIEAGSAYDPRGLEGAAHLWAKLSAEGGTQDLSYPELLAKLHPWAARIEARADKQLLTFTGRCHVDHVQDFLPIFLDVVLQPRLGEADFERLRQRSVEQLTKSVRTSNDEELAKLVLEAALFEGHGLAHPSLGTQRGLEALQLEALRAHRAALLTQDRVKIGLAGAVDDAMIAQVRAAFGRLPAVGEAPRLAAAPTVAGPRLIVVAQPKAPATAMAWGQRVGVRRGQAQFPALAVIASHFGEHRQFRGVLFQRVREARGLNYGTYAYPEAFIQEGWGRFPLMHVAREQQFFSLWVRPVPNEAAHFTLRLVRWLYDELVRDGLTEADVQATVQFLRGYEALKRQTVLRRLGDALDARFYGIEGDDFLGWLRAGLGKLDAAEVNGVLRGHLSPEQTVVVVVTPDAEGFVKAVLAGEPSPMKYASEKPEALLAEDAQIERLSLGWRPEQVHIVRAEDFARE